MFHVLANGSLNYDKNVLTKLFISMAYTVDINLHQHICDEKPEKEMFELNWFGISTGKVILKLQI